MFIDINTKYISTLQNNLISNHFILLILTVIENLPITYQVLNSSFYFTSQKNSQKFISYLEYISYYVQLHNLMKKSYTIVLFIISLIFYGIFVGYKLYFFPKFWKKCIKFHSIFINFYEIFIFRIFSIFFLDFEIFFIVKKSFWISLFSLLVFIFIIGVTIIEFNSVFILINFETFPSFFIDNTLHYNFEFFNFFMKIIICFINNLESNISNESLLNILHLTVLFFNCLLFVYQTFLLLRRNFIHFFNEYILLFQFLLTVFLSIMIFYIIIVDFLPNYSMIIGLIQCVLLSIYITYKINRFSFKKITDPNNGIGQILLLIKNRQSLELPKIISFLLKQHLLVCNKKQCKFCALINQNKINQKISIDLLNCYIYCFLIKHNPEIKGKDESLFMNYLELIRINSLSVKNKEKPISIILEYHHIKNSIKCRKFIKFSRIFLVNLEILQHIICKHLIKSNENFDNSYLITVDNFISYINSFFSEIVNFFSFDIKDPLHFLNLTSQYTLLKDKVDCNFLVSKENKYLYSCIIIEFVMEQIFNKQLISNYYLTEVVTIYEDLLDVKYKTDRIILIKFDIKNKNNIIIQQCSNELIDLKDENFKKIFPDYLSEEGHKRLFTTLTSKKEEFFEFYYQNRKLNLIEALKMKFYVLHSLNLSSNYCYILCQYLIEKDNILVFKRSYESYHKEKRLVALNEILIKYLQITPYILENAASNNIFLTLNDFITSDSNIVNFKKLKAAVHLKLNISNGDFFKQKNLSLVLKETIGVYEVYLAKIEKNQINLPSTQLQLNDNLSKFTKQTKTQTDIELEIEQTKTAFSCSLNSMSSFTSQLMAASKKEQNDNYTNFHIYSKILYFFNFGVLVVIGIFLPISLTNNVVLEKTFTIIKNYNDFQTLFYHSALSVLSLTCNADYLTQTICVNQFTEFCYDFSIDNGLTEKEMMNEYLARELPYKSEMVVNALKVWENDRYYIDSTKLDKILNEPFIFDTIEENPINELFVVSLNLTFEEAIKRFVNIVYQIPKYDNHLTAVIWTITIDGNGYFDLINIKLDKKPINGRYLTPVQKLYYSMLINFQKYLFKLFSMTEVLHNYYEKVISKTSNLLLEFLFIFLFMHLGMLVLGLMFTHKFKILHMFFFIAIFEKINNKDFKAYFLTKIDYLKTLIDLYREPPMKMIKKLSSLQSHETRRRKKEFKVFAHKIKLKKKLKIEEVENTIIDTEKLNNLYNIQVIWSYISKLFILFMGYCVICLILYFMLTQNVRHLSLMNTYIKYQYGINNKIYMNLGLVQVMSLTNQTDIQIEEYFNGADTLTFNPERLANDGYVRKSMQQVIDEIALMDKLEKQYSFFYPISSVINIKCDSLYHVIDDNIINSMVEGYPESDYISLLIKYCDVYSNLRSYPDEKMSMSLLTYKTGKVLDLFVDQTYQTYEIITNCLLLYQIYTEILMIIRPISRYLCFNLLDRIINEIISQYNIVMALFLAFNCIYEIIIIVAVKFIITKIVILSEEVIMTAKAFECL